LVRSAGTPEALIAGVITSLDKLDKEPLEKVREELVSRGVAGPAAEDLLRAHQELAGYDNPTRLQHVKSKLGESAESRKILGQVEDLMKWREDLSAASCRLLFDPFLARGMDYYTDAIFEIYAEGVPFSLAGGGSYNDLLGVFCGQKVHAVGFSIGFERIYTLMEERKMFGAPSRAADVLVVVLTETTGTDSSPSIDLTKESVRLAKELRAAGLRVDLYLKPDADLITQFALAEKKGIPWAAIPDPRETAKGNVNLRDLAARKNTSVPRAEAAAWLKARL
jgi:histidyl-tRNA synthetase